MTKEEAEDYIDSVIKHALSMVEYSNYFSSVIKSYADEAMNECEKILLGHARSVTKRQKSECESEITGVLEDFKEKVDEFVAQQLKEIAESENEYLEEIGKTLGISFAVPAAAVSMLSLVPIATMGNAKDFGQNTINKLDKVYDSIMNQGQIFGEDYEDVLSEYEGQFNSFKRGLDTEANSLGYSLGEEYERIVFTKTDSPKLKYMWTAILDTTTCLACGMLDHKVFDKIEDVPMYPLHLNCRCTLVCGTDEIFEQYPESYQKWFEKQSEKDKYSILGKTRYNLYKQGMKIKQFINNNKVTPLVNLKLPKNLAIVGFGARSEVINKLNSEDILKIVTETESYYNNIRTSDNTGMITKIAENTGKDYSEIEKIVNHVFIQKHHFMDGRYECFGSDPNIVKVFERLRTKEFTDQDILLLNHEFLELTYMKNKKYNIYEIAHEMANKKYNWEETLK